MLPKSFIPCVVVFILMIAVGGQANEARLGQPAPALKLNEALEDTKEKGIEVRVFWTSWADAEGDFLARLNSYARGWKETGVRIHVVLDQEVSVAKELCRKIEVTPVFTIGKDAQYQSTMAHMAAFKVESYPYAFIVDQKGRFAWHGESLRDADRTVRRMQRGWYDIERVLAYQTQEKRLEDYFSKVAHGESGPKVRALGMEIVRFEIRNPLTLNQFAWSILTDERVAARDIEVAIAAARAAYDMSQGRIPAITDTLARAHCEKGEIDAAIRLQKEAISRCRDETLLPKLKATLATYEAKVATGKE